MRTRVFLASLLASASAVYAATLEPDTAAAFQRYVTLTERRIQGEVDSPDRFLWIDTVPQDRRTEMQRGLQQGGVVIERLRTRDGSASIDSPGALIHHWVSVVFVPNATAVQAVALMQDYNQHATYFKPAVVAARILAHEGSRFKVAIRFNVKKVISVTMDTENEAEFVHQSPERMHSRIRSTRVTEISDAGTPNERPKAPGDENGFMWNLNTYWRFLERDGGTYVQCESLSLSRDVPFALAWIIRPIITQMPRESLMFTMGQVRAALAKAR